MIEGYVNRKREAIIKILVSGDSQQEIDAIIDTGYSGFLTLPSNVIKTLNLSWYMQQELVLGDGSICMFDVYEASIVWNGRTKQIEINESETHPLVGMGLLDGHEVNIQAVPDGIVTIKPLF
jgi:clan AA aspartic protease